MSDKPDQPDDPEPEFEVQVLDNRDPDRDPDDPVIMVPQLHVEPGRLMEGFEDLKKALRHDIKTLEATIELSDQQGILNDADRGEITMMIAQIRKVILQVDLCLPSVKGMLELVQLFNVKQADKREAN